MLKRITLNGRRVPVPVPILDLVEAVEWLQKHLVRPDHHITRIELNGSDIDFSTDGDVKVARLQLDDNADLRVKVDSPSEICLQTLDVLRNLSSVIGRNLRPVAVQLWEHKGVKVPVATTAVFDDFSLMQELLDHILLILDKRVDAINLLSYQATLNKGFAALNMAVQSQDWKGAAKVLLNQIEAPAGELADELSSVEKVIFELMADKSTRGAPM